MDPKNYVKKKIFNNVQAQITGVSNPEICKLQVHNIVVTVNAVFLQSEI